VTSCSGYGEADHCGVVYPRGGEAWAACIVPPCWYWLENGVIPDGESFGACEADGAIQPCRGDGTLAAARPCANGESCQLRTMVDGFRVGACK
jgi:hypothetical protein